MNCQFIDSLLLSLVDTHGPRVQLLFHRHHGEVTLPGAHVLGAAASFEHVHFLRRELAAAPEIHIPGARGHHGDGGVGHGAQPAGAAGRRRQ